MRLHEQYPHNIYNDHMVERKQLTVLYNSNIVIFTFCFKVSTDAI